MFTVNKEDNSIYATRGDIVFFSVSAMDEGVAYHFQPGDIVRITVYGKKDAENVVLQKDFPVTENAEIVEIFLSGEDTKFGDIINKPTDYWYEVELNPDTNPQTIIGYNQDGAAVFRLFPEGGDIEKDEHIPTEEDIPFVDEELDLTSPRPVANQAISRAIVRLDSAVKESIQAINSVVPDSFGAVGDGEADDTESLQKALDSGSATIDLAGKVYRITAPLVLHDGQTIQNGIIDGKEESVGGLECTAIAGDEFQCVTIQDVIVRNCTERGIYLKRCKNSSISGSIVENIVNNTSGAVVKGIVLEFCKDTAVSDCTVHNIVSLNDADGIHFLHDDTIEDEIFSGNVVSNCVTYDCGKRHYKIQECGVTLEGCKMIYGELGVNVSSCLVAVYDSYVTIKGCFFDAEASNPVIIGAANNENDHDYRQIIITKNRFIHRGTAYQGAIFFANASGCTFRDIIITDNSFRITNNTEYALYIRNEFDRVIFNNNIIHGGNSAVCVRDTAVGGGLACNSNMFAGEFTLVYLTSATIQLLSAVGNVVHFSSGDRTVYLASSSIVSGVVNNTKEGGVRDFPFTIGQTSERPTVMLYNGFQYFDMGLQKPLVYYNGAWKDATGATV